MSKVGVRIGADAPHSFSGNALETELVKESALKLLSHMRNLLNVFLTSMITIKKAKEGHGRLVSTIKNSLGSMLLLCLATTKNEARSERHAQKALQSVLSTLPRTTKVQRRSILPYD